MTWEEKYNYKQFYVSKDEYGACVFCGHYVKADPVCNYGLCNLRPFRNQAVYSGAHCDQHTKEKQGVLDL